MRLHRIAILILAVVASVSLVWIFSPATIIPPADPADPVTVHVVDYGFHSRLVLPDGDGKLIQYAYGDWNYFALNQQDWSDGAAALLVPTQGTLGRRKFSNITELRQMIDRGDNTLLNFEVAGAKAIQLLASLDERFNRNINTRVENPLIEMTLVQDDQDYTLFHNSNHELVLWLKDLDCRVEGFVMWANFQVKYPKD